MNKNDGYTRCKQCGKVIVGGGKMGLCDSCFNSDAEKAGGIAIAGGIIFKFRKQIWNGIKTAANIVKGLIK